MLQRHSEYKRALITPASRELGAYLRYLRNVNRLTQKQTAALIDINQGLISRYESGIRIPTTAIFKKYKDAGIMNMQDEQIIMRLQKKALANATKSQQARVTQLQNS